MISAQSALAAVRADRDALIQDWLRIAGQAAPLGAEHARAEVIASALRALDGLEVWVDDAPNVYARKAGNGNGPRIAVVATLDDLDTIAELRLRPGAPLREEAGRVIGPCVATASSDAMVVAILRAMQRLEITAHPDLLVVCVCGEETGLTGMRRLIAERAGEFDVVVEVLGGVGTVSFGAIGVRRLEIQLCAEPVHSLRGGRSTLCDALARLTLAIHELSPAGVDHDNWSILRVNGIHAGQVSNHSPAEGTLTVDVRSTDDQWLDETVAEIEALTSRAAAQHGASSSVHVLRTSPSATLPSGANHPWVVASVEAIEAVGCPAVVRPWSSSNLNVASATGIAGVAMEGTLRGDRRGELDEWCDIEGVVAGVAANLLLLCGPLATGAR